MKDSLECLDCGMCYEGIENEDLMYSNATKEENQLSFHIGNCITHNYLQYKKLEKIIDSGTFTKEQELSFRSYRSDFVTSKTEYSCGYNDENGCDFSGSLSQILEHEKSCMGIRSIMCDDTSKEVPHQEKQPQAIEKSVTCDLCNKRFIDYPNRKMKIKHQLIQHKKTCRKQYKKKRRRMVIEFLKESADQDIIDSIFTEYKDIINLDVP